MSVVDALPGRPIRTEELESLQASDALRDIAPAAFKSSLTQGTGASELIITTASVVVGVASIDENWEVLYRGEIGTDGGSDELHDEAYDTLEANSRTPV